MTSAHDGDATIESPVLTRRQALRAGAADYRPTYNAAAAADGWKPCLAHLETHLKA